MTQVACETQHRDIGTGIGIGDTGTGDMGTGDMGTGTGDMGTGTGDMGTGTGDIGIVRELQNKEQINR
jgi:hypothetical protein